MRPVVLLAMSVFGACYPLLLLLLLLCDHHFKVWGLKEQVETPSSTYQPGDLKLMLPLWGSVSPSVQLRLSLAVRQVPSSPDAPA